MGKFAWVTLATNDSYSMGALVLAHSLRRVNTAHQLVILVTPGVTEAMKTQLSAVFNVVKLVDVLDSKDSDNLALLARPELGITFTKLHCWKLTDYEKCVFLDADTLVLQNSDELFDREELSAAPDAGWPDCFNSGVFVYKPSNKTFQALIEFALIHGSFDGGDQGLLNLFFSDWATKDIKKHLPFVYNMCSTATYSYLPAFKQFGGGLKIIHFIGAAKPWLQPFNTETGLASVSGESHHIVQFVQLWWDIFCANVHPSLSTEMAGLAGALATVTLGAPLTVEQRALEEHLRRQGWEQGNIDYMGKDSFANIWEKICETLGTTSPAAPPKEVPAPVAPVAAPVYVSSVEISPTGQIDKTPPQANYAPVSALKPTVEVSDSKDHIKAPTSETATVASEPKSSVTEVVPTEASIPSSATLETPTPTPQIGSEPPALQQPATPLESAVKIETAPATPPEAPAAPSVPPTETSVLASPVTQPSPVVSSPPSEVLTSSPVPQPSPVVASAPSEVPVSSPAPQPTPAVVTTPVTTEASVAICAPTEVPISIPASKDAPLSAPSAPTPTETKDAVPVPTETPVPSPQAPTSTETIVSAPAPTPTETMVSAPALTPTETIVSATAPTPSETPITTPVSPVPVSVPLVPTPTEPVAAIAVSPPTETPVPAPSAPKSTPTEIIVATSAPAESPASPSSTEIPLTPSSPVPSQPAPTTPPISPSSVPIPTEPSAPAPAPTPTPAPTPAPAPAEEPANVPKSASESIAPAAVQPQTPTVTGPTPPTSPSAGTEAPQLTKLLVEAEIPATPPVGSSVQPSLEGAAGGEPPVPPKRKGGSKAPQEGKNQKGGKPSKGKK